MTSPPQTVNDVFPNAPDPGKQLVDPAAFYQLLQLTLGYQVIGATAAAPGPTLFSAVTRFSSPGGAGPFNIRMPIALAGLRLTLINLASGPVNLNPSYNPAFNRADQIVGISPMPSGNVYAAIAYQPGFWYVTPVTTGIPLMPDPPTDEPPPEEC